MRPRRVCGTCWRSNPIRWPRTATFTKTPTPTKTYTDTPTITNTPTPLPRIVINEFVSNPIESGTEWIELYNKEVYTASLEHFTIEDNTESPKRLRGLEISANGFLVLEQGRHFDFYLNNGGDTIKLKSASKLR